MSSGHLKRRVHRFSGLTVVVALLVLAGSCTGSPPPTFPARVEPDQATVETVMVERRDVTTVVALDAVVTAGADYVEVAPRTGVVEFPATAAKPGAPVRAGALLAVVGDREVRTRFAAFVVSRLVPSRSTVTTGLPVVSLRLTSFGLVATVPAASAYRLLSSPRSARGQINNGPGPFDCPVVTMTGTGAGARILCVIPDTALAFDGLPGIIGVATTVRQNVLAIPIGSVTSLNGVGEVWKVTGAEAVRTEVRVGATDGVVIEIVSGLAEGDRVLPYSPSLRRPTQ